MSRTRKSRKQFVTVISQLSMQPSYDQSPEIASVQDRPVLPQSYVNSEHIFLVRTCIFTQTRSSRREDEPLEKSHVLTSHVRGNDSGARIRVSVRLDYGLCELADGQARAVAEAVPVAAVFTPSSFTPAAIRAAAESGI